MPLLFSIIAGTILPRVVLVFAGPLPYRCAEKVWTAGLLVFSLTVGCVSTVVLLGSRTGALFIFTPTRKLAVISRASVAVATDCFAPTTRSCRQQLPFRMPFCLVFCVLLCPRSRHKLHQS